MKPLKPWQAIILILALIPIGLMALGATVLGVASLNSDDGSYKNSTAQLDVPPKQWFAIVADHSACFATVSPADAVRALRSTGQSPQISDAPDGAAKVEFEGVIKMFYRSKEACDYALQDMNDIDQKYEAASNTNTANEVN